MLRSVRAKYTNGALKPLEAFELEEGTEVVVTIEVEPALPIAESRKTLRSTCIGAWRGTHDPKELLKNIYSDRLMGSRPEPRL